MLLHRKDPNHFTMLAYEIVGLYEYSKYHWNWTKTTLINVMDLIIKVIALIIFHIPYFVQSSLSLEFHVHLTHF